MNNVDMANTLLALLTATDEDATHLCHLVEGGVTCGGVSCTECPLSKRTLKRISRGAPQGNARISQDE